MENSELHSKMLIILMGGCGTFSYICIILDIPDNKYYVILKKKKMFMRLWFCLILHLL